jgi:hypothetical protein
MPMNRWLRFGGAALAALALVGAGAPGPQNAPSKKRTYAMGFTVVPYDITPEALQGTLDFVKSHSDLISFNLTDGGVPWIEALEDKPFPNGMETRWKEARGAVPAGYRVFVYLNPLNKDRNGLSSPPEVAGNLPVVAAGWAGRPFDDRDVVKAYANYCRRVVQAFQPDYLSIAHECTRLVHARPKAWDSFARLCKAVRDEARRDAPKMSVGVTHVLPLLWNQQIARVVKPSFKDMDFTGLSFFPYAGIEAELYGGRALPQGRDQWVAPLRWARKFSEKPLAICDTAYTTKEIVLAQHGLKMKGDPQVQKEYVSNLLELAQAEDYLFVVWQLPVDCDRLALALPQEMQDFFRLFQYNGLATSDLRPKPALEAWDRELRRNPRPE